MHVRPYTHTLCCIPACCCLIGLGRSETALARVSRVRNVAEARFLVLLASVVPLTLYACTGVTWGASLTRLSGNSEDNDLDGG